MKDMKDLEQIRKGIQHTFKQLLIDFINTEEKIRELKRELLMHTDIEEQYEEQLPSNNPDVIRQYDIAIIEVGETKTKIQIEEDHQYNYKCHLVNLLEIAYKNDLDIFTDLDLNVYNFKPRDYLYSVDFFKDIFSFIDANPDYEYFSKYKIKNYNQPFYNKIANKKNLKTKI